MMNFGRDLQYSLRLLLKNPVITLAAVFSLALGIGANTAIFGIINALMLRSLPIRHPQQLVSIGARDPKHPAHSADVSLAMFHEIRQHAGVFSHTFVWYGGGMNNFEANGIRYAGSADGVSGDYFDALGIRPTIGRVLTQDDAPLDGRPSARVAVISYGCWEYRFHRDPQVLSKILRVDGIPLTIVGVSAADFTGLKIDIAAEATVPIGFSGYRLNDRESFSYTMIARLKPDIPLAHAQARIQVLWPAVLKSSLPDHFQGAQLSNFLALRPEVISAARGNSYLRERLGKPLLILMALVGAVLLIACINLSNLLLAHVAARQREIAIRIALGASRWPLVRMMLGEALMLSLTGAAAGFLLARPTGHYLLGSFWTGFVPITLDPSPDIHVLIFTATLALFTGVLFGIVPAWRMSRADPARTLSQGGRFSTGHMGHFSRMVVTTQFALSLVLLTVAALFVRSLENLRYSDYGYRFDHLLLIQLFPQPGREKIPDRSAYYHEIVTRILRLPGVEMTSYLHMGPGNGYEYRLPVAAEHGRVVANAMQEWAGPGLFRLIGMHILAGREFEWRDDEHAPCVAILSESLARTLFPGQDPIGRIVDVGDDPEHKNLTVIGIVNSASLWKFQSKQPPAVYHALLQEPSYNYSRLLIRTSDNPKTVARSAERLLESLGHHYSLRTETSEERMARALILEHMIAVLASGFSALALLLAAVGLYGVLSYVVARRAAEIGVRMALGAVRMNVICMILVDVLRLLIAGVSIAIPIVFFCGKLIAGMLFGTSAVDPAIFAVSFLILAAVAVLASFLPAYRASRVDLMTTLRSE